MIIMLFKRQKHFSLILLVIFLYSASASEYVPLLLWSNIKDLSCEYKPQGPGETISSIFTNKYTDCLSETGLDQVLVFVYDKFSVGDISTFGQSEENEPAATAFYNIKKYTSEFPSRMISSVQPSQILEDLFSRMLRVTDRGNIKIIRLPSFDRSTRASTALGLQQYDEQVRDTISNTNGKYLAIVTSENTPDDSKDFVFGEGRGRQILSTSADVKGNSTNTTQYFIGNCIYMSFKAINLTVSQRKVNTPTKTYSGTLVLQTPDLDLDENCLKNESAVTAGNVSMTMHFVGADGSPFINASVEMMFQKDLYPVSAMNWWTLAFVNVDYVINTTSGSFVEGNRSLADKTFFNIIAAPLGYSFACASTEGLSYVDVVTKPSSTPKPSVRLHFDGWQVQPFQLPQNKTFSKDFSKAVDCVGWYTEPIISGLLVTFLLVTILTYGICMASTVTTMDRFDNPKGKSIIVQQDAN